MQVIRILLVILGVLLAWPGAASAADGPGTTTVRRANVALASLLRREAQPGSAEEKRLTAEVRARLGTFLDVDELGKRALASHYEAMSAEQRKEFTATLRELVEANYIRALRSQLAYEVRYLGEKPTEAGLLVNTEVHVAKKAGREVLSIAYVLKREGDALRVFDVITDGVGLVENYRSQFNKVIAKEGISGLLARMRKKLASTAGAR